MQTPEEKVALLEKGEITYIEGDVYELRERLAAVGEFFISQAGNGLCKVARAGRANYGLFGWVCSELKKYGGKPVAFIGNVTNVRNYVSRYNSENGTSFRVRSTTYNAAEIYSDSLEDYASITREQFDEEWAKVQAMFERLRSKIVVQDQSEREEDEEEEEDLNPDPSIFFTRTKYASEEEDII